MSLNSYSNYKLKIRFFEANKFLKAEFTNVNEDVKNEVSTKKKQF